MHGGRFRLGRLRLFLLLGLMLEIGLLPQLLSAFFMPTIDFWIGLKREDVLGQLGWKRLAGLRVL